MAIDKAVDSAVLDAGLTSIANAIRAKSDTSAQLNFPDGFTDAVKAIQSAKPEQTKTVDITSNGTITVTPDNGNVLSAVTVNVNVPEDMSTENSIIERSLTEYTNSEVKAIGIYALAQSGNLIKVSFPNAVSIGSSAFQECKKLVSVSLPKVKQLQSSVFYLCIALTRIDFPAVTSISSTVFVGCTELSTVVIRSPSVCSLGNISAFRDTPIEKGVGFIYVPDNLVDQYKASTNWTVYASQIKPLSELPEVSA